MMVMIFYEKDLLVTHNWCNRFHVEKFQKVVVGISIDKLMKERSSELCTCWNGITSKQRR